MSEALIPYAVDIDIQAAITQRYVAAAGLVIVLYDIILTWQDEATLIWNAPSSLAKCLFFFNRYTVPIALTYNQYMMAGLGGDKSDWFCFRYLLGLEVVQILEGGGIIPLMLLLRVYALYGRSLAILVPLGLLIVASVITCIVLEVIAMSRSNDMIVFLPIANMCMTQGKPPYLWAVWFLMTIYELTFESVIFSLIIFKTWKHARVNIRTPILTLLARDGVVYFAVMLALIIGCLISYTVLSDTMYLIVVYLTWSLHSTLISRIYLNLRNVRNCDQWGNSVALREDTSVHAYSQPIIIHQEGQPSRRQSAREDTMEVYELVARLRMDNQSF